MKRIVVLIDGTWGKEGAGIDTNVAKLDLGLSTALAIHPDRFDAELFRRS